MFVCCFVIRAACMLYIRRRYKRQHDMLPRYLRSSYVATYSISAQFSALLDILGLFLYVVILSILVCEGRDARSVSTCKRLVLCARLCLVFAKILCEVPSSFVCYASFQLW